MMEWKNYIRLPDGKLAIKDGSLLDWLITHLIPLRLGIGWYQITRIGPRTDYAIFSWRRPKC